MEYKIPKSTIRSFIDVLRDTKINLNAIKNNTNKEKEKISTQFLISDGALKNKDEEEEIKCKFDLCNLILNIITKLELTIDKLINSYNEGVIKEYIPLFDVIVASLKTENDFATMIILDVIKSNAKFNNKGFNGPLEEGMASLIEEYQIKGSDNKIKESNTKTFLDLYQKYLQNGYLVIRYLTGNNNNAKRIENQILYMKNSLEDLPSSYLLYTKKNNEKKELVLNNTPVFTENNEIKYYMDGGKVLHLCDPKEFYDLLIQNGYSSKACYSMLKKMIKEIKYSDDEIKRFELVSKALKNDIESQKKWEYVWSKAQFCPRDLLKDIYNYFYMVSGIDDGYGYSNADILELMVMELDILYARMDGPKMDKSLERKVIK